MSFVSRTRCRPGCPSACATSGGDHLSTVVALAVDAPLRREDVSHGVVHRILSQPLLFVAVALVALPPLSNPGDRRLRASLFGGLVGAAAAWTSAALFQAWPPTRRSGSSVSPGSGSGVPRPTSAPSWSSIC